MFTNNINFINFKVNKNKSNIKKNLKLFLKENNQVILSLSKEYKNNFKNKNLAKFLKKLDYRVIGMGALLLVHKQFMIF